MLQSLRVSNFALIEELEMGFEEGLNILTGETGAGKSILLGSIQMALGAKTSRDLIRTGAEAAYVELVFDGCGTAAEEEMRRQELSMEDGSITISRKITTTGKSVCRINGETVNAATVKAVSSFLLEIHGQQEHHSLLNKDRHLDLLDRYAGNRVAGQKAEAAALYVEYRRISAELAQAREGATNKNRDCSYLAFAVKEIKEAEYKEGELEELEKRYERLSHARALAEGVAAALEATADGTGENADGLLNTAARSLSKISGYDSGAEELFSRVEELSALLSDFNRSARSYLESLSETEEEYRYVTERLDLLNRLKSKYGRTMEEVLAYGRECEEKLARYADYDAYLTRLEKQYTDVEQRLEGACAALSESRKAETAGLVQKIRETLSELNFLDNRFEIRMERTDYTAQGYDTAEFYIATNPGEEMKPLIRVASGGELSRIMLALKSVFADRDEIPTLVFDEIDTGISGRTAQMVSEKMAVIAGSRQLLCITHLPQIAAMADAHFYIEKTTDGIRTVTSIRKLSAEASVKELARMLGGASITEAVLENAREMKAFAKQRKQIGKS